MARLTEIEILDRLKSSCLDAAAQADQLSRGERGPIYPRFRENIDLIHGCCRQMSGWREDARWGQFGLRIHECRERCRRWLVEKHGPKMFRKLADILREAHKRAVDLETKRTGRRGILLPDMMPAETRTQGRSILVPAGFKDIRETAH